jgi:hypothetical protein
MRSVLVLLVSVLTAAISAAADLSAKDLVAQLYQAHRSKHDPLDETQLLGRYFDAALLKLYLKDQREAKGEVGRLDGDPLYNAQDIQIKDLRSLALAGRVCLPDVNCRSATGRLRFNAGNGRSRNAGHGSFQEPR